MKICLISASTHPVALGLRYVSASLKAAGHQVEMLFMCSRRPTAEPDFPEAALNALVERCRSADLIGMSLMTNTFHRCAALARQLRAAGIKTPIIWGGTHPTVAPEESLEIADAICVGEGEQPAIELAEQMQAAANPTETASFWFRAGSPFGNHSEVRNPVLPLPPDLDSYPFPDYDLNTQWVVEKGELVPARPDNLRTALQRLRISTTRGCPCSCSFCNNTVWQQMYKGKGKWVRIRSNDNIMAEVEGMVARFPTIQAVNFVDDLFFVRSEAQIDDFVEQYRRRVNIPLELDAFPNTVTEPKVASLSRLPIALISMGIQSGSPETLENIYHRATPLPRVIDAINLFHKYRIPAEYHYIISNPYEKSEQVIETMRFAAHHHKGPAVLRIFPLMFYPGAPLRERAVADGLIKPRDEDAYRQIYSSRTQFGRHDYLSIWLRIVLNLKNLGAPTWLLDRLINIVTSRPFRRCLDRRAFPPAAFITYRICRKLYMLLVYQPFVRPFRYLRANAGHPRLAAE